MFDKDVVRRYIVAIGDIQFEWDPLKNISNQKKHGISFEEAATVFSDSMYIEIVDPDHSQYEERFIAFGISERCKLLAVCYSVLGDEETLRIFSSREATANEARQYGEKTNAGRI